MTIEQLKKAHQTKPFRAFDICLADGQRIRVRSPEFILVPPTASRTFVVTSDPEDYQILDLLRVTALDFSNGSAKTRRQRNGQ